MPAKQLRSGPETLRTACLLARDVGAPLLSRWPAELELSSGNDVSGAPATAASHALCWLLVSYRPLADEASDEDFLGPEAYEAIPRRLLHGYLAVSSSSFPKILGN